MKRFEALLAEYDYVLRDVEKLSGLLNACMFATTITYKELVHPVLTC
jgi:hypothetical protein